MHSVVPRGYPAYTRIFHPAGRDRPAGTRSWHGHRRGGTFEPESERVAWSTAVRAFGTSMHPLAQFHRLTGPDAGGQEILDARGWRYFEPSRGNLDVGVLAEAAAHLCHHTATPDRGAAAVWDGWGGLTSSAGYLELSFAGDLMGGPCGDTSEDFSREAVGAEPFTAPFAPPFASGGGPGSGLLPAAVVNGPTLELPGRNYYLFSAGARDFTDPGWAAAAPWNHDPRWPQSPSILWPQDRAWVLVTEIDFDSTVVAGSRALITALSASAGLEALPIPEGSDLSWDADEQNRPPAFGPAP